MGYRMDVALSGMKIILISLDISTRALVFRGTLSINSNSLKGILFFPSSCLKVCFLFVWGIYVQLDGFTWILQCNRRYMTAMAQSTKGLTEQDFQG